MADRYNACIEQQIAELQQQILDQVQMHVVHCDTDAQLLQFAHESVHAHVGTMDAQHVADFYDHLKCTGAMHGIKCKDRIQALHEYLYACIELELAVRYA